MIEYIAILTPVLLGMIIYFVRLEGRISKIITDICWIKKELKPCPPISEKSSR